MGRNQYDISEGDIRNLRSYLRQQAVRSPEEAEQDRLREQETSNKRATEERARRRRAKEEAALAAAEKARRDQKDLAGLNKFLEEQGFGKELFSELLDPHLGMDHGEYLRTPLWRKIRRRVLKRDSSTCQVCSGKATEVHHRSYDPDVLLGKKDEGCISLCAKCHHALEFTEKGEHRSVEQKESRLISLLNRSG